MARIKLRGNKPAAKKSAPARAKKEPPKPVGKEGFTRLYCEEGKHWWHRERQRGRQPLNCPKHQPVKVEHKKREEVVTLHCQRGDHDWEYKRPARGNIMPKNCPEHRVVAKTTNEPKMVELYCVLGNHKWERPSQRGKKPMNCPEHQPATNGKSNPFGGKKKRGRKPAEPAAPPQVDIDGMRKRMEEIAASCQVYDERYAESLEMVSKTFNKLDRLENKKKPNGELIERAKQEYEKAWRRCDNAYNTLMGLISASNSLEAQIANPHTIGSNSEWIIKPQISKPEPVKSSESRGAGNPFSLSSGTPAKVRRTKSITANGSASRIRKRNVIRISR